MPRRDIGYDEIIIEPLSRANYSHEFNCDFEDDMGLNTFYHNEALAFHKEKLGRTHVFLYEGRTIGFVTLAMESIPRKKLDEGDQLGIHTRTYPALLIGRLAVDNGWRGSGVGTWILKWCLGFAVDISERVGCRYVVLQTNKRREGWYRRDSLGFKILYIDKEDYWLFKKIDPD